MNFVGCSRLYQLLLPLLLHLALPVVVQAQWIYETNNGTITITGYTGPGDNVTIPATINGLPVTGIGSNAFYYKSSLTSVAIPDSVTSIGDQSFSGCSSLTSVTIPDSITASLPFPSQRSTTASA